MTTSTLTVTDFVLARIAEDEAVARAAGPDGRPLGGHWVSRYPDQPDYHMYGEYGWFISGADVETDDSEWGKSVADHITRHDPARVLAQCAAMRKIVELAKVYDSTGLEEVLIRLASIWSDHPDWREEWA